MRGKRERLTLGEHYTAGKLLRFVAPSVAGMLFTSLYTIVDGYFVSNYAGKTGFAAVNLIYPVFMIIGAFGFMLGIGGTALVSRTMGEQKPEEAAREFSVLVFGTAGIGLLLASVGFVFLKQLAALLGAEGEIAAEAVRYGTCLLIGIPFFMLQNMFQSFYVAAEKARQGLTVTVLAGCTNIVLDYVLVGRLRLGVTGAGAATALSQFVGSVIPLVYFGRKNDSRLRLKRTKFSFRILLRAAGNGAGQMVNDVAWSVALIIANLRLLQYAGENGVDAYGVIGYVSFIFMAVFLGYGSGVAPLISYHFGAGNTAEMRGLVKKSVLINLVCGILMASACYLLSRPLAILFVGYDAALLELTAHALRIYAWALLLLGLSLFSTTLFTALENGRVSATISLIRLAVFRIGAVLFLPLILGVDGIWFSDAVSEVGAVLVATAFFFANRRKYRYL